jgi:hypothetical protein
MRDNLKLLPVLLSRQLANLASFTVVSDLPLAHILGVYEKNKPNKIQYVTHSATTFIS